MEKSYNELIKLKDYNERLLYLRCDGRIEHSIARTRINWFYRSKEWLDVRQEVIVRDYGHDCAFPGKNISSKIVVHHINPITDEDILNTTKKALDPNNLVCVSNETHLYIHYGTKPKPYKERSPGDTTLW